MSLEVRQPREDRRTRYLLRSLEDGRTHVLNGEMLVGRELDCQVRINSRHVSRYQAKLQVSPLGVIVEDLHSTNGTYVNGRRISAPRLLSVGDEVSFYASRFELLEHAVPIASPRMDSLALGRDMPRTTPVRQGHPGPEPTVLDPDNEDTQLFSGNARNGGQPRNW